jgi:hypothetical protein
MAALVDLYWADASQKKIFDCSICKQAELRGCQKEGYSHLKKPMAVDNSFGRKFEFCPGKATWSARMAEAFQQCLLAYRTGILPRGGHFEDQDAWFYRVYPTFVHLWREHEYQRQFKDLAELMRMHADAVLAPWKDKKKGGK